MEKHHGAGTKGKLNLLKIDREYVKFAKKSTESIKMIDFGHISRLKAKKCTTKCTYKIGEMAAENSLLRIFKQNVL